MRRLVRSSRPVAAALLSLWIVLSAIPPSAEAQPSHLTVIRGALRSAVQSERRAIQQLAAAAAVEAVHQGAQTAHEGYAQMRRAIDRLGSLIEINQKVPDPVLRVQEKQVERARYLTRLGLNEVEGVQRYDPRRVQKAIENFQRAIQILEVVLAGMV